MYFKHISLNPTSPRSTSPIAVSVRFHFLSLVSSPSIVDRMSTGRTRAVVKPSTVARGERRRRASVGRKGSSSRRAVATRDDDGVDEVRYHSWRGHRVGYRTNGESGAAVVLIHGFGVSSYQFREILEALGANHRVFALDLVGFGSSSQPDAEYKMEFWRDQVIDFVENVVGEPAVLVGNSIGSLTAVHVAARNGRLKALRCLATELGANVAARDAFGRTAPRLLPPLLLLVSSSPEFGAAPRAART